MTKIRIFIWDIHLRGLYNLKALLFSTFLNSELQEGYAPPVFEDNIEVDKRSLKIAVENAKKELDHFARQLIKVNKIENLNIPEIDKRLIYGIDE